MNADSKGTLFSFCLSAFISGQFELHQPNPLRPILREHRVPWIPQVRSRQFAEYIPEVGGPYFNFTGSAGRAGHFVGAVFIRASTSATARSSCGSLP
jgi:hypothetical protein